MFTTREELEGLVGANTVSKYPLTDISYSKSTGLLFVEVALAGFQKGDINIKTEGNTLVVLSEGISLKDSSDLEFMQKNIASRGFKRVIMLDDDFVGGEVDADFENGLLTISIMKNEKPTNTISIN